MAVANQMLFAHGPQETEAVTLASYGTDWLYLLVPLAVMAGAVAYLFATGGSAGRNPIDRVATSLERATGFPAWSSAPAALGLGTLIIAVIGFMWDVAWHIDMGRDRFLFTPPHTLIVVGLGMLVVSAAVSVMFATRAGIDHGWRFRSLRIPYGAVALGALGMGALTGFPLDELWHGAYGVDVTMWGPTHLLMIGGASFSPFAMWLLLAEGRNGRATFVGRHLEVALAGASLIGLSTFQGEFDFGVPQFQQLYHPVLVVIAASIALSAARRALGPGGALKATAVFLLGRGALAMLIGSVFDLTVPHFPLYLVAAVIVEVTAGYRERRSLVAGAVLTGGLVASVGLGAEWAWTQAWGWHPWGPGLLPALLIVVPVGIAGAYLGAAAGRILAGGRGASKPVLLVSAAVILFGLALPFVRNVEPIEVRVSATEDGGRADLTVDVSPAAAVEDADWFEVLSWQGDGMVITPLRRVDADTYESTSPAPASGRWKTMLRLAREDVMVSTPIYMPADHEIDAPAVPLEPVRTVTMQRDTESLLREATSGPAWPSLVAYLCIALVALGWMSSMAWAFGRVGAIGVEAPARSYSASAKPRAHTQPSPISPPLGRE